MDAGNDLQNYSSVLSQLDKTDLAILKLLQSDARLSAKEIAHQVGLTVTPTYERLKKIEKSGVIKGYATLLHPYKIGKQINVFCNVTLQVHTKTFLKKFEETVMTFSEVMECYHIAGNFDYLLKVTVEDMKNYQNFVTNKLANIENIAHVHSSFVMTEIKHTTSYSFE